MARRPEYPEGPQFVTAPPRQVPPQGGMMGMPEEMMPMLPEMSDHPMLHNDPSMAGAQAVGDEGSMPSEGLEALIQFILSKGKAPAPR